MQIVVQHLTGSKQGSQETFNTQSLSIGRDPGNDLSFDASVDLDVSSRHAQINSVPGQGFQLVDLGSTNGTFVNGQKVNGAVHLANGSLVEFGKNGVKVQIRFQEGMGQMPGMMQPGMMQPGMMQPGMMQPGMGAHAGMMAGAPPAQMGPPQKGARTQMFEAAIDKSTKDAKKTKRLLCCSVVGFMLLGVLGVGIFIWVQMEDAATRAWHAKDNAANSKDLADASKLYEKFPESKALYAKAEEYFEEGEAYDANWDYDLAEESFNKSEKLYAQADSDAKSQNVLAMYEARAQEQREQLEREKQDTERNFRNAHEDLLARIANLQESGGDQEELRELEQKRENLERDRQANEQQFEEREKEIEQQARSGMDLVGARQWIVCRVTSQAWVVQGDRDVAKLGEAAVGTGVFVEGEYVLTAKSIAKPHYFNEEAKAMLQYYTNLGGQYAEKVRTTVEMWVPLASDDGLTSDWMVVFQTANSSLGTPPKTGLENDAQFHPPKEVRINVDAQSRRVEGVKTLKDNENNWALFKVNIDHAFPDNAEGRAQLKKIHGGALPIQWQRLANRKPQEFEEVFIMGVTEAKKILPFNERIQDQDPFSLDERFDPFFIGAPVFNGNGQVLGLIVRPDDGFQMAGIAATHIKPE